MMPYAACDFYSDFHGRFQPVQVPIIRGVWQGKYIKFSLQLALLGVGISWGTIREIEFCSSQDSVKTPS